MTQAWLNRIATAVPPHDIHSAFVEFGRDTFADMLRATGDQCWPSREIMKAAKIPARQTVSRRCFHLPKTDGLQKPEVSEWIAVMTFPRNGLTQQTMTPDTIYHICTIYCI